MDTMDKVIPSFDWVDSGEAFFALNISMDRSKSLLAPMILAKPVSWLSSTTSPELRTVINSFRGLVEEPPKVFVLCDVV